MEVAGGSARGALEIRLVSASVPQQSAGALRASLAALAGGSRRGGAAEAPLRRHEVQLRLPRRRPDAPLHALTLCRDVTDTAGGGGEWTVRQAAREASTESSEFVAAARAVTEGRASANALELLEAMGYELVEATVIVGYEYEAPPGGGLFLRLCRRLTPERPRDADSAQLSGAEPWVLEAVAGGADVWAAAAALEAVAALLADFVTLKPPAGAIPSTKGGAKGGAKRKR